VDSRSASWHRGIRQKLQDLVHSMLLAICRVHRRRCRLQEPPTAQPDMQDMQAKFIVHVTAPVVLLIAGRVAASFISTALLQFDKIPKLATGSAMHPVQVRTAPRQMRHNGFGKLDYDDEAFTPPTLRTAVHCRLPMLNRCCLSSYRRQSQIEV
jgi:hypothetical protein